MLPGEGMSEALRIGHFPLAFRGSGLRIRTCPHFAAVSDLSCMNEAGDNLLLRIQTGRDYHVVHLGRQVEVRAISRSSTNPHFWVCEDLSSRQQMLIPDHAFRQSLDVQ